MYKSTSVYNLETRGEHVYQIGDLNILVHNACSNSYLLGKAMAGSAAVAKFIRSMGYAAGHIVPARGFSRPNPLVNQACINARAALKAANININGIFNGFWTKSSRHLGSHTDEFLLEMGSRLKGLTDRTEVLKKLMSLKDDLFAGKFL